MVIRKHDEADLRPIPPIPTQVVTNGEFVPLPKTQKQREVDLRLMEYADRYGTPRGLSRRRFLMTASGFAAAMLAMNKVYGREFFRVAEVEAADEAAAIEAQLKTRKGSQFVFDDQTHWLNAAKLEHAKTERGQIAPNDPRNLDMMEWQAKDLKIDSWKGYTADGISGRYPSGGYYGGWYLDDVKVAYPMYEKARKLGIKTFCIHKGLAVIWFDEKYCRLHDLEPAALANPDLNFIIYHSGYPWVDDLANITRFKRNPGLNAARVYGINVEQTMKQLAQDTISNVRAAIAPKMTEEFRKYAAAAGMKLA